MRNVGGLVSRGSIRGGMPGIGGDEGRILNGPSLDRETPGFELALESFPKSPCSCLSEPDVHETTRSLTDP